VTAAAKIRSYFGARRKAYNWALGQVQADMDARKLDPGHASVAWNLYALRKRWNVEKVTVAPWWARRCGRRSQPGVRRGGRCPGVSTAPGDTARRKPSSPCSTVDACTCASGQLTTVLAETCREVVIEDLDLAAMKRSMGRRAFRRSVSDAALGRIRPQLTYKMAWRGLAPTVADRWFASSKIHHGCGCRRVEPRKQAQMTLLWACSVLSY
jgi:IS605 OrfB family transposase